MCYSMAQFQSRHICNFIVRLNDLKAFTSACYERKVIQGVHRLNSAFFETSMNFKQVLNVVARLEIHTLKSQEVMKVKGFSQAS